MSPLYSSRTLTKSEHQPLSRSRPISVFGILSPYHSVLESHLVYINSVFSPTSTPPNISTIFFFFNLSRYPPHSPDSNPVEQKSTSSTSQDAIHQDHGSRRICCSVHLCCKRPYDCTGDCLEHQHHHGHVAEFTGASIVHQYTQWPSIPHWPRAFPGRETPCLIRTPYFTKLGLESRRWLQPNRPDRLR